MTGKTTRRVLLTFIGVVGLYCLAYLLIRMSHLLVHHTTFAMAGHLTICVDTHYVAMPQHEYNGPEDPKRFYYYLFTPLRFLETEAWDVIHPEGTILDFDKDVITYPHRGN